MELTNRYSETSARDKNRDEYNQSADAYERWCASNILMQKYCYYSTLKEIENEGIRGKTFLEVGCGPCPIGKQLAKKGAKKIYGLDISSEMIETARQNLTDLNLIDKFELVCFDIFDDKFTLPEKVDCVVLSYTMTTFINSYEMLSKLLSQCSKVVKDNGFMLIADFEWVAMPKDNWWAGMYTKSAVNGKPPKEFEVFHFMMDLAPETVYEIFHIPSYLMIKAGLEAGFQIVEHKMQYPDPSVKDNPVVKRYVDECTPTDYLIKFKFQDIRSFASKL